MSRRQGAVLLIAFVLAVGSVWLRSSIPFTQPALTPMERTISFGTTTIAVEVVDTPETMERGLSGRPSLEEGRGMLFVYSEDVFPRFWMKDMHFSLDILFLAHDGTIVALHHNVTPQTYPQAFGTRVAARYVLEVPAGYTERHGLAEGGKIVVQ